MIEKLDTAIDIDNLYDRKGYVASVPNGVAVINKINEIIDVINTSQSLQTKKVEPVDGFKDTYKKENNYERQI